MGRAYSTELSALGDTYEWARTVPIDALEAFVSESRARPLLAVGSGGSATAAHLAALLHRTHTGAFARHATPLEVLLSEPNISSAAVLLLSASGRNRDVLSILDHCIDHDVRAIATLCTRAPTPLAKAARQFERAHAFEVDVPAGKDGFLATNSLLATCTFLVRAFGLPVPSRIRKKQARHLPEIARGRTIVQILHGGWGAPVATDLESKLNESAIASAQVSDYRNFGHGRHLSLARRGSETVVLALVTPETAELAERTLELLPSDVPVIEAKTAREGPSGTLELLVRGFHLVGSLAEAEGFDPGRPSVPDFGRKLFHLPPPTLKREAPVAVMRKLTQMRHLSEEPLEDVQAAFHRFLESLIATSLGGLVLDYDGTLCTRADRFQVLRPDLAKECRRLLEGGLVLGIATGRGRSVRESLQKTLPRAVWDRVLVGYYNGGEIASLARDDQPSRAPTAQAPLNLAKELLDQDRVLLDLASLTTRRRQITIEPKLSVPTDALMKHTMSVLAPLETHGVRVLTSSHSVDVLPPGITKLAVVDAVRSRIEGREILCIGDRGTWPGNDTALLSHKPSLSVDEVSASLATCWNIAPPGLSGPDATLQYLRCLRLTKGTATFVLPDIWRSR
jgi:hydroxymethylpyrimidine pyrophosphatase-like HAD family hydrolase